MLRFAVLPLLLLLSGAVAPQGSIEVDVEGLRNTRGLIHVCITQDRRHFPDCTGDPRAITRTVPANIRQLRFSEIAPGRYAITLFHDENANQRLDRLLGIPREGFGFSRNPVIRFGAPRFDSVDIELGPGFTRTPVRVQYLL
jgi:uncharacterized protein (DUF2141 family)